MDVLQHVGPVSSVAFSPDGKTMLTHALNDGTYLWETATRTIKRTFTPAGNGTGFALYSPAGRTVFSPSYAFGEGVLYDVEGDGQRRLWKAIGTFAASYSHDGSALLIGGGDGEQGIAQCLELETGDERRVFETHQTGVVGNVAYSPGDTSILASMEHDLFVCHREAGKRQLGLRSMSTIYCAAFSPDGTAMLAGCEEGVRVWDSGTGNDDGTVGGIEPIHSMAFSPDSRLLLTGGDGVCRLWQWPERTLLHLFAAHSAPINCVTFSPMGRAMLTGSDDTTARLWQVPGDLLGSS